MSSPLVNTLLRWWFTPRIRSNFLTALLACGMLGLGLGVGAWTRACTNNACPSIAQVTIQWDPAQASKVYAADGRLITDLGEERRTVIPLSQISPEALAAFITVEDKRFFEHGGVDWIRALGALRRTVVYALTRQGRVQGFSTITMQLARNLWPEDISGQDRTIKRKLREMHVAFELEHSFTKDRILELYLNQINLGNGALGIEAAAQRYFGKSARDLNMAEAATLAGIPRSPTRYNPRRNPDLSVERRNLILQLMADEGVLSQKDADRWKAYPLLLSSRSDFSEVAPYFVEYVRQLLKARFGSELYSSGLRIYTTLDLDIQQATERALLHQLDEIERDKARYGPYPRQTYADYLEKRADDAEPPSQSPYLQGLAVVLEAKTGRILAMVGGRDFNDSKFNRVVQAQRQPGSTFKPIVYTAALRAGHPWSEIVDDSPISVEMLPGEPPWEPQNYDLRFDGPMPLKQAFYDSRNIPAIKIGMLIGPQAVIGEAARFGIGTYVPAVPSIYIGSASVIPLEMIAAFTPFATMGTRATPFGIERVEDRNGSVLWEQKPRTEVVMDSALSWLMLDGLRDVVRRGTAASVGRDIGSLPAGGKTGTTNDGFDVWYIGFTPDLVGGLWIGMDQPQKIMDNAQGGRLAAPAWSAMMKEIYERRPLPPDWPRPNGLVIADIDPQSGKRWTPFCPKMVVESYLPGTEPGPKEFCPIHNPWGPGGAPNSPLTPNSSQ
ncbi:MAG TPA: PBP1A family penicillin-binding protein [Gemmatimonadales bacterium]|nr:PBP1A family penicillin-binding protein [Gemmatimonadales bacterium]